MYLDLHNGDAIAFYDELILVCEIPKVYISRRALKHFVERRKDEMINKYSYYEILYRLTFTVQNLQSTILKYDSVGTSDNVKYIYSKYFETEFKSYLRIVTEKVGDHQEVKSIHYKKNKKATH